MAEKGILIADQAGGESIACRDAVELDNDSNSRVIQLVHTSNSKGVNDVTIDRMDLRSGVYKDDWSNRSNFVDADVTSNLLTIGDKATAVFTPFERADGSTFDTADTIDVIVLAFDKNAGVVGVLFEGTISCVGRARDTNDSDEIIYGTSFSVNVLGSYKVGVVLQNGTNVDWGYENAGSSYGAAPRFGITAYAI